MRLNDYTVPNREFLASVEMEYKTQDTGSQTSSTDSAHQGMKPKRVSVSLFIPFVDADQLGELTAIAESTKGDGSRTIYNIADKTCNAMKIRQVQFTERFSVQEDGSRKGWRVSFSLDEYKSVPEKVEQRTPKKVTQVQSAPAAIAAEDEPIEQEESESPPTGVEKLLGTFDNWLK